MIANQKHLANIVSPEAKESTLNKLKLYRELAHILV